MGIIEHTSEDASLGAIPNNSWNIMEFTEEQVADALEKHYKKINSDDEQARVLGSYYYATIWNGRIVAIWCEERNYSGWDLATSKDKEKLIWLIDKLKTSYEAFETADKSSNFPSWRKEEALLYEKIKDMEISDSYPEELDILDKKGPLWSWDKKINKD